MNQDDIKVFQKLIKDELRPIKDLMEVTKKKVDNQELFLHTTAANVRSIKEQQSVMNEKLDELNNAIENPETGLKRLNKGLDTNTAAVVDLERTVKGYADMYQINDSNVRKVAKRVEVLEGKSGITPPQEHLLADIQ